jgi:CSLREA domain-containing protein
MGSAAKRVGGSTMAIVTLMMILAAPAATAATYTVNTTTDPPGGGCTGGTCSLRQAITAVNAGAGAGDRIDLPAGRIVLSLGVLSVGKPVTIAGAGARASIVDANATSSLINFSATASPSVARDLTFTGGRGSGTAGIYSNATLTLTDVAVTGNVATSFAAAGVYNESAGNLTIERSTISGNSAGTIGGGVYNLNVLTITNSTISGNTANTSGSNWEAGGVYTNGTATIVNSTIAGNTAHRGGGLAVQVGSTAFVRNTIVAQNTATGAAQPGNCRVTGTLTSQGSNLEDTNTCGFGEAGDLRDTPAGIGPLQDNGGAVDTRALVAGSAGIDRGSGCPATDARGVTRPQQGGCDIGAYEFAPPNVTTGNPERVGVTTASIVGTLQPNLRASDYHFEYGKTAAYGSTTPSIGAGSGGLPLSVGAALTGLKAATTYHYRLVAGNADGTAAGADRTFTTARFAGARLLTRRLRANRRGVMGLNLSCPAATAGGACTSVASLYAGTGKLPGAAARRTRRAKLLGRARFSIPAGQSVTKRLRLSRRGRKAVKKGRVTRARMLLTARDAAGNTRTVRYRVNVRASR